MGSTAAAAVSDDDDSSLPSSNSGLRFSTELKRQEVRSDKRERKGENEKVYLSLDEPEKKEKREFSLQSSQSPSQYEIASSN